MYLATSGTNPNNIVFFRPHFITFVPFGGLPRRDRITRCGLSFCKACRFARLLPRSSPQAKAPAPAAGKRKVTAAALAAAAAPAKKTRPHRTPQTPFEQTDETLYAIRADRQDHQHAFRERVARVPRPMGASLSHASACAIGARVVHRAPFAGSSRCVFALTPRPDAFACVW